MQLVGARFEHGKPAFGHLLCQLLRGRSHEAEAFPRPRTYEQPGPEYCQHILDVSLDGVWFHDGHRSRRRRHLGLQQGLRVAPGHRPGPVVIPDR